MLQRAICALIVTHPDPEAFAKSFGLLSAWQQVDQIAFVKANPAVLAESKEFAQELIELANEEVQRRASQTPPAG